MDPSNYTLLSIDGKAPTSPDVFDDWTVSTSGWFNDESYIELVPNDPTDFHFPKKFTIGVGENVRSRSFHDICGKIMRSADSHPIRIFYGNDTPENEWEVLTFGIDPLSRFIIPAVEDDGWTFVIACHDPRPKPDDGDEE